MSPVFQPGRRLVLKPAPPGELLKRPHETSRVSSRRAVRVLEPSHLEAVRLLPCLNCGLDPCGEAAHVRMNSAAFGKRQAMARKPDDRFALPLCFSCHQGDSDAQHRVGEDVFWARVGLNPLLVCEALHKVSPDVVKMRAVVFSFVGERR